MTKETTPFGVVSFCFHWRICANDPQTLRRIYARSATLLSLLHIDIKCAIVSLKGANRMEFLMEFIVGLYMELMMLMVPERGEAPKKYRKTVLIIAVTVLLSVIALFTWGAILLTDYNNNLGYIPITIALVISIAQIVAGVILYNKKSRK